MNKECLVKEAQSLLSRISDKDMFKRAFDENIPGLIKTVVREESFVGRILNYRNVDINTPGVQRYTNGVDGFCVIKEVESNASGFATSFRTDVKPHFPDTKIFEMDIGKLRTPRYKKPYMELKVASNLVRMIQENGINYLARMQDAKLLDSSYRAVSRRGWPIPHHIHADWSAGVDKADFIDLRNTITLHELLPAKVVMGMTLRNTLAKVDNVAVDYVAGDMYHGGVVKDTFDGLPYIASIKVNIEDEKFIKFSDTGLGATQQVDLAAQGGNGLHTLTNRAGADLLTNLIQDGVIHIGDEIEINGNPDGGFFYVVEIDYDDNELELWHPSGADQGALANRDELLVRSNGRLFDFALPPGNYEGAGQKYSRMYMYVDADYLGDFLQFENDQSETEWREDIFEWTNWRYVGMGFGDIRGIACMTVRIQ